MNRLKLCLVLTLAAFFLSPLATYSVLAAADGDCSVDANGYVNEVAAGGNHKCYVDMQGAKITWHALYLCREQPSLATHRDTCEEIFYSTTGVQVQFLPGTTTNLPTNSDVSLPVGTYNYAVTKVGKYVHDKMVLRFSANRRGRTGTGTFCWTIANREYVKSNRHYSKSGVECGTEADSLAAGFTYQNSAYICDGNNLANESTWAANSFGKTSKSHKVSDDTTLYTPIGGFVGTCPTDVETFTDTGNYTINMQQLITPAVITPDTKTIQFSMGLTGYGMVSQRQAGDGGGARCPAGGADCVIALRSKAPEFKVTVY